MLAARDYMQHDRVSRACRTADASSPSAPNISATSSFASRARRTGVARRCRTTPAGARFTGTAAIHATGVLIAGSNRFGAATSRVQDAVQQIEDAGDASGFLTEASTRNRWRGGRVFSLLNSYRGLGAMKLSPTERLALEMSVHEETERRAMEGELAVLEAAWRDAENIAADQRRRAHAAEALRVALSFRASAASGIAVVPVEGCHSERAQRVEESQSSR